MSNGLNHKIKVLFPVIESDMWLGGVNYYTNLFHAISMLKEKTFEVYVFQDNPKVFFNYVKSYNLFRKDIKYVLDKFFIKLTSGSFNKKLYCIKRAEKEFDCFSHCNTPSGSIPSIGWIPDFQHRRLPEMFSEAELAYRDSSFENIAKLSKIVLLSSNDALSDFVDMFPEYSKKARVLNFVSYIDPNIYNIGTSGEYVSKIKQKYNLPDKYFYLPNQFWKHKNHITVFKAVNLLKTQGLNVKVLCSGLTQDYRNKTHFDSLKNYISSNNLNENIKFLGKIDLDEVYYLMRYCVSIINPSLFEGWSSTVEEAKSLGKNIILSNLNVHREQNPPCGVYFDPLDVKQLALLMKNNWLSKSGGPDFELEAAARKSMDRRMLDFATNYKNILFELFR